MSKKFQICFAGDTSLGDWYLEQEGNERIHQRLKEEPSTFIEDIRPIIQNSDFFALNLETVLWNNPDRIFPDKRYPNWDDPQRTVSFLKGIGVNIVSLANNHSMDFGPDIMLKTKELLTDSGIMVVGAGENLAEAEKPLHIQLKGELSSCDLYILTGMRGLRRYREDYDFMAGDEKAGINFLRKERILTQIKELRELDDKAIIILFPHWQGIDYQWASDKQGIIQDCRDFIDCGARYIIGHGPHMINGFEEIGTGSIAYSIGNFIFNSSGRYKKMEAPPYSAVVYLEIEEENDGWKTSCRFYPFVSDNRRTGYRSRPADSLEMNQILNMLSGKTIDENMSYVTVLKPGKDQMGNYFKLDTEKNDDILRTLNYFREITGENTNFYHEKNFKTSDLLTKEFEKHGFQTEVIDQYLIIKKDEIKAAFLETESSFTSLTGYRLLKNKAVTRVLMEKAGVLVMKGSSFNLIQKEEAAEFAMELGLCVVKPADGNRGRGVTVGVKDTSSFEYAWNEALKWTKKGVIIEKQFVGGKEARFFIIDGKCVAVAGKIPPIIVGDGKSSIRELVDKKNTIKKNNPYLGMHPIKIDDHRLSILKRQGYTQDGIPKRGENVLIDWKSSISSGGDTINITEEVHQGYIKIAEKAASIAPGLDIIGIDILAHDFAIAPNQNNYTLVEANTRPAIGLHQFPAYGEQIDIAWMIVDNVISKLR